MRKVKTGDKFAPKAKTWNNFIDAAEDFKNRQAGNVGIGQGNIGDVKVKVRNNSGETWGIFTPVVLIEPLNLIADAKTALKFAASKVFIAEKYTGQSGTVAIVQEIVKTEKIGQAMVSGVTPVTGTIFPGSIIWQSAAWAVVRLGESYTGPFKIIKSEFGLEVINGMDSDDVYAGFAMVNGKIYPVEAGIVSEETGYLCLVTEEQEGQEEPLIYFQMTADLLDPGEGIYPVGYVEVDGESGVVNVTQFYHSLPQLWIVGTCEEDEEEDPEA